MRPHRAPLGDLSVEQFLARHWQRAPLLIRGAFPAFRSPITRERLFELAARDHVESRLVSAFGGRWRLRRGPFALGSLPAAKRRRWTLLVQGVDRELDAMHALLARFRFVPDARLDDLMVSYATDGGGVGPHVDSYDVFLLQAQGRRRWRVGRAHDDALVPGLPLKVLAHFEPDREWTLEPGDMLYLPPGWAHEGVAIGECMTFSVGFRAPSRLEFLSAWLAQAADDPGGIDPRYRDPNPSRAVHPARIPDSLHAQLARWARSWRASATQVDDFIGRFLTEPPPSVWFDSRRTPGTLDAFVARASARGLRLDRRTRMAWRATAFFVNGERAALRATPELRLLADGRSLDGVKFAALAKRRPDAACALHEWWSNGWLEFATPTARAGQGGNATC